MTKNSLKNLTVEFVWRIASAHVIAYFIAGIFALVFMKYREQFGTDIMAQLMRSFDSPWVSLGPALQLIRGVIISIILLPIKDAIISKNGWLKLMLLVVGFSYVSTIGPTFGSFEGYVYTKIPVQYHFLGIPEALLYTFLFSYFVGLWYRKPKRAWNAISIVFVALIVLLSIMGATMNV